MELTGDVGDFLGMGQIGSNALLIPDVDDDGLGELLVSPAGSFEEFGDAGAGSFDNPGYVEVWSPERGERLARLDGERGECSFGLSIDSVPDQDGDGYDELLVVDGGCATFVGEPPDRMVGIRTGDRVSVFSTGTWDELWSHEDSEGAFLGVGDGAWVAGDFSEPAEQRIAYRRVSGPFVGAEPRFRPAIVQLDLGGSLVREWENEVDGVVREIAPWNAGVDIDGDDVADGVGLARDSDSGVILYPAMARPVGSVVQYTDCSETFWSTHLVPDVDGDLLPDVFVQCLRGERVMRLSRGQDGANVWTRRLEPADDWVVAEPEDLNDDGCIDLVAYQSSTRTLEIVWCAPP